MRIESITFKRAALVALALLFSGLNAQLRAEEPEIAVVVKIGGIPWFTAMEKGIKEAGKEQNVKAYMIGPTTADPAQQVRAVEDLIAKKVSAIGVVPNDAKALEPVFERAKAAGIPIITHESPDQKGNVWDIELIDNKEYGETPHERLRQVHGRGRRIHRLRRRLDGSVAQRMGRCGHCLSEGALPKMKLVADRYGVAESVDDSYKTALDAMLAHPNLKGILTFGSQGPIGAGRAIKERGKADKIVLVGTCSPTQGKKLVKDGIIKVGYMWSPMKRARRLSPSRRWFSTGRRSPMAWRFPVLERLAWILTARVIRAIKMLAINKDTVDELVALGL